MYNCFDVAKVFLKLAQKEGIALDTMKLLKMTYIAHGYYLGFFKRPLFSNEVQAWKYGPVIPDLYHVTKRFGTHQVALQVVDLYAENPIHEDDEKFLGIIWNTYKKMNGLQLSSKTHKKDSPWDQVFDGAHYKVIDNAIIEGYYQKLINDRRKSA